MTSITVLDELLGSSRFAVLAPEVVQLFRTARKRNSSVWGISQILEDFIGMEKQPRLHGPGIIKNATTKIIGQQHGDFTVLINHLFLNEVVLREIKNLASPKEATRTQG